MRIKLKTEQLGQLSHQLPFEVLLERPQDVKGFLEILGRDMPWDEVGLNKYGDPLKKPGRVAFEVTAINGGFVCDVHPAFACYISDLLNEK